LLTLLAESISSYQNCADWAKAWVLGPQSEIHCSMRNAHQLELQTPVAWDQTDPHICLLTAVQLKHQSGKWWQDAAITSRQPSA